MFGHGILGLARCFEFMDLNLRNAGPDASLLLDQGSFPGLSQPVAQLEKVWYPSPPGGRVDLLLRHLQSAHGTALSNLLYEYDK